MYHSAKLGANSVSIVRDMVAGSRLNFRRFATGFSIRAKFVR
jgi:hypothetical protein